MHSTIRAAAHDFSSLAASLSGGRVVGSKRVPAQQSSIRRRVALSFRHPLQDSREIELTQLVPAANVLGEKLGS
jgi:hypothetical protein